MQKTILIVEDDADLRISLRKILTNHNFKVLEAANGAEALERVEKERPDLVLLDFGLPLVPGETVCIKIKENHPEIVIIALTEKSSKSEVVHGLQIGADDYMSKPFIVEELVARIDARLKNNQKRNLQGEKQNSSTIEINKLIIRESIVLIIVKLIVAEFILGVVFALSSLLFLIFEKYFQSVSIVELNSLILLFVFIANIGLVLFIVLKWIYEYSELTQDSIIKRSGILFKKEKKFACNFIETITLEQSIFGVIFNYGTIELYDPALKERIYIVNIANPKKYKQIIEKRFSKNKDQPIPFVA